MFKYYMSLRTIISFKIVFHVVTRKALKMLLCDLNLPTKQCVTAFSGTENKILCFSSVENKTVASNNIRPDGKMLRFLKVPSLSIIFIKSVFAN